jgi:hypothetical protein
VNVSTITAKVGELVPDAKDVRTRDTGQGIHALSCELHGKTKSVQFNGFGLYPPAATRMWGDWLKSDLYLAAEIAKELRT